MTLDLNKIANLRPFQDGYRGACPACREDGSDRSGDHLLIRKNGKFGCAVFPGNHEHRQRIKQLVGLPNPRQLARRSSKRRSKIRTKTSASLARSSRQASDRKVTAEMATLTQQARWLLYSSPEAREEVAAEFGVSEETVRRSTMPSTGAIGLFPQIAINGRRCLPNRIGYIYPCGVKIRLPWGNESKKYRFAWLYGSASEPWRFTMAAKRKLVTRFVLTEGESDALNCIDDGVEKLYPKSGEIGTAVLASPGTSFRSEWAPLMAGRDVLIAFDLDAKGREAAGRVAALISPYSRSVQIYRPQSQLKPCTQ